MNRTLIFGMAALAAAGCAQPDTVSRYGFDFGPRRAWVKAGATDLQQRRDMIECGEASQAALENGERLGSVPILGLIAVAPILDARRTLMQQRTECMQGRGWELVDVVTGQPQTITYTALGVDVAPRPQ